MRLYLHPQLLLGALAQLVEQWTENPCVPGSIPGGTTIKNPIHLNRVFWFQTLAPSTLFQVKLEFLPSTCLSTLKFHNPYTNRKPYSLATNNTPLMNS